MSFWVWHWEKSLYPAPGTWSREETRSLGDTCPIVCREEGARAKLPEPVGMPRASGKRWGCQAPSKKEDMAVFVSQHLSLVWDFEFKTHWHFYSGTCLFLIFVCLGKGKMARKFLNTGDVHSDSYYAPWPVCWNPRIFIKIILLTRIHEILPLN